MKKMLLVMAAGTLFAAGTAQAQSETVTSVNVVGYYSVTIPANRLALVTPVLESFGSGNLDELVGQQVPVGSKIYVWDRVNKNYIISTPNAITKKWNYTNTLVRGDVFWIKPLTNGISYTITMMGEVPGTYNSAGTTTVANVTGTDAVGYTYPIDIAWTNTTLSVAAGKGATMYIWNASTGSYTIYTSNLITGNWNTPAGFLIKAGEAFWIKPKVPLDWIEEVPYDL